jgi:hypothetical protein
MADSKTLTYYEKVQIANKYIGEKVGGITWNDLPDINSLHDCDNEQEIIDSCNERLNEDLNDDFFEEL